MEAEGGVVDRWEGYQHDGTRNHNPAGRRKHADIAEREILHGAAVNS